MSRTPQTAFDPELRAALDRLVPEVQTGGKWHGVEAKLKHKRRQSRIVQAVALTGAVVLLVAFGTWAADFFRQPDLIVIDDRDTDEVGGSEATQEVTPTSEEELLQTIQELIAFLEAGEIELTRDPEEESGVTEPLAVRALRSWEKHLLAPDMTLILQPDANQEDIARLRQEIESLPQVERYEYLSSDEALKKLGDEMGEQATGEGTEAPTGEGEFEPPPARFEIWLLDGPAELNEAPTSTLPSGPATLSADSAVASETYSPPNLPEIREGVEEMLSHAEPRTAEAKAWLEQHLESADSEGASAFPPVVPATEGDPFGPGPGNTGDRPGYLTAWPDLSLEELRRRVVDQVEAPVNPDTGRSYVYLPSELPGDFLPAGAWGEKLGSYHNPAVDGAFYGAAFSNNETAIRLVVNPDLAAPSFTLGALTSPDVRDNHELWKATGASVMGREAYDLVRDGIVYFRFELPESTVYLYGPEEIRSQIWKLAESLAPVAVEPPA